MELISQTAQTFHRKASGQGGGGGGGGGGVFDIHPGLPQPELGVGSSSEAPEQRRVVTSLSSCVGTGRLLMEQSAALSGPCGLTRVWRKTVQFCCSSPSRT